MRQPTAEELRQVPPGSTVKTVGSTYWSKTGPDVWHRSMEARGRGRSSAWITRHAKIIEVERSDVQVLRLIGTALTKLGGY